MGNNEIKISDCKTPVMYWKPIDEKKRQLLTELMDNLDKHQPLPGGLCEEITCMHCGACDELEGR